jgi:Tfp pilus assembly protein PilO
MKEDNVPIKNRQQFLVIVTLVVVGLFAVDRVIRPPLQAAWKNRNERIADLRSKVREGESTLKREKFIRERWEQMQTNTLPNNTSLAEQQLLKGFDQWAQDSRVSINSVMPQWKQDMDNYKTLECRVDASGSLETLSKFLYNIERDPMALKLQSVELTAHDNEGRQLTLALQVSALVLTPKEQK